MDLNAAFVISDHDHMNATRVQGYEGPGEHLVSLRYSVSQTQIESLKAISSVCKQHIKWQCVSAVMKNPYNMVEPVTFFLDKDGVSR